MKITMIVAKIADAEMPWILGAWDEYTIDGNEQGFLDAIAQYRRSMPSADIRTAQIEVPESFLESIWKPVVVQGKPVAGGAS